MRKAILRMIAASAFTIRSHLRTSTGMLAALTILLPGLPALASDITTGTITTVDFNADASTGRGMCIAMNPAVPNIWACLLIANPLYRETAAALMSAYLANKVCSVTTNAAPPGSDVYNEIRHVSCQ
jgi:hypothetical protein